MNSTSDLVFDARKAANAQRLSLHIKLHVCLLIGNENYIFLIVRMGI